MTPTFRKTALAAHITSSVGWLGAVAAFLALAIAGLTSQDAGLVRSAYRTMGLLGWSVIVPLSLASLLTGLVQSLGTEWGLFRHHWVLIKFVLTILAVGLLLLHMRSIDILADAAAGILVLLVNTTLSAFKPRGLTRYGRRKQREQR